MQSIKAWLPPDDPDPFEILHEGVEDTREARYEIALAKFLWFHESSLKYNPSLSAVRLSFALGYWWDLAKRFSPALGALYAARDAAERAFQDSLYEFDHFHEIAAINRTLGEGKHTAKIFNQLRQIAPEAAERVYRVAEPFLIETGDYLVCGPFLDPRKRVELASKLYKFQRDLEQSRADGTVPIPKLARKHFTKNVATLVALLVLNDRLVDAKAAYTKALETLDDSQFRETLDAALTGHFSDPN